MKVPASLSGQTAIDRKHAKYRIRNEVLRKSKMIDFRGPMFIQKPIYLIVVLGVMAVISAVVINGTEHPFNSKIIRTNKQICDDELQVFRSAIKNFRRDCGRYPKNGKGTKALIINSGQNNWQGPYVTLIKNDPWGHPYIYELFTNRVVIFSRGPDGERDTWDDLLQKIGPYIPN